MARAIGFASEPSQQDHSISRRDPSTRFGIKRRVAPNSMKLLTILTDPDRFPDRLRSISEMSKHVDENVVICKKLPSDEGLRRLDIQYAQPSAKLRSRSYFSWAAAEAHRLTSSQFDRCVIVEIGSPLCLLLLRFRWRTKAKLIQQLVTPSLTIWRTHGWSVTGGPVNLNTLQNWSWWLQFRRQTILLHLASRYCDGIIANSQQCIDEVLELNPKIPAAFIPNCVYQTSRVIGRNPISHRFLMVSSVQPYKGIAIALESLRDVITSFPSAEIVIAGRVPKRDEGWFVRLKRHYSDVLHRVRFLGNLGTEALFREYCSASALIHPSFYEGSPRAIYEALALGCPVVASDIPGIRELAIKTRAISTFRAGDARECARIMRDLMSSTRDQSRQQAASREAVTMIAESFSPQIRARRLYDFLETM